MARLLFGILILLVQTTNPSPRRPDAPSPAAFKAIMGSVRQECEEWKAQLKSIDLSTVSISYAQGSLINQEISVVNQNLYLAALLADRIIRAGSLADEVNLMYVLKEIYGTMNDVAELLVSTATNDDASHKQLNKWSELLGTAANGKVNKLYNDTAAFVWDRADRIDHSRCDSLFDK
jgi:hypothetical protein